MKTIEYHNIIIRIYTDPMEYALMDEKPFGEIPEGATFAGVVDLDDETKKTDTAGFVSLEDKTIRIYVDPKVNFDDLLETVSHEMGHLVEGGFKKNPPPTFFYAKKHEEKAKHYEKFVMDCYFLTRKIFECVHL